MGQATPPDAWIIAAMETGSHAAPRLALIVEDCPQFTQLVAQALAGVGPHWQARCVATGGEALDFLARNDTGIDLMLADLGLPDMSGTEVIRAARARYPEAPIMVISTLASNSAVLSAIQAGARGYLRKFDSALSLSRAIANVLAGEYPISPSLAHYLFKLAQTHAPATHFATTGAPFTDAPAAGALSPRELELLRLLGQGRTYGEAADKMAITLNTAQTFARRIYQKLQVGTKGEALETARDRGWL